MNEVNCYIFWFLNFLIYGSVLYFMTGGADLGWITVTICLIATRTSRVVVVLSTSFLGSWTGTLAVVILGLGVFFAAVRSAEGKIANFDEVLMNFLTSFHVYNSMARHRNGAFPSISIVVGRLFLSPVLGRSFCCRVAVLMEAARTFELGRAVRRFRVSGHSHRVSARSASELARECEGTKCWTSQASPETAGTFVRLSTWVRRPLSHRFPRRPAEIPRTNRTSQPDFACNECTWNQDREWRANLCAWLSRLIAFVSASACRVYRASRTVKKGTNELQLATVIINTVTSQLTAELTMPPAPTPRTLPTERGEKRGKQGHFMLISPH